MKIQNTLISILIINFNNAKFLTRAINSCLNQSYKNFEILRNIIDHLNSKFQPSRTNGSRVVDKRGW